MKREAVMGVLDELGLRVERVEGSRGIREGGSGGLEVRRDDLTGVW